MFLRFVDASGREENKFIKLKISVLNQNSPQNDENITVNPQYNQPTYICVLNLKIIIIIIAQIVIDFPFSSAELNFKNKYYCTCLSIIFTVSELKRTPNNHTLLKNVSVDLQDWGGGGYRKQNLNVFYQVCAFRVDQKTKMVDLASDWPIYFRLLLCNR